MKTKYFLIPVTLALAAAPWLSGCAPKEKPAAPPAPVLVTKVFTTNMPVQIQPAPVGHVMPISTVTIRPQIGGIISKVHFAEGEAVQKGDLLFTIDPRPSQAALEVARAALARDTAQLENAKIQFARDQKLFNDKIESQDLFDTSKANVDALSGTVQLDRASVSNAELNLEFTSIRAPVSGRTGGLQFHEGNVVKAPDDVLLTINQIQPIYASFAVAERYLPEVQKQMRLRTLTVTASFENLIGEPPTGDLTFVDNAVDQTTGTILLKATFPNTDAKLWPGQFVQMGVQLDELKNVTVVPSQTVQNGQNGSFVFVIKADDSAESRPVKTSVTVNGLTAITSGLQAGETVVTDGQLRLAPGVIVSAKSE